MEYLDFFKQLHSFLRIDLSNSEFHTLLFIGERTLRYNKTEERIPLRHFLTGVYDRAGNLLLGRVTISKPSLLKGLEGLKRRGLIAISYCDQTGTTIYRVLVRNIEKAVAMIKELSTRPAKKKWFRNNDIEQDGGKEQRWSNPKPRVGKSETSKDTQEELRIDQKLTSLPSESTAGAVAMIRQKVEEIRNQHQVKREQRKEALTFAKGFRLTDFHAAWRSSCEAHKEEFYGEKLAHVPPSRKEVAIFRNSVAGLELPINFKATEFIDWAVSYWPVICDERFYWMHNPPPPAAPDQRFFMRFVRDFYTLYLSRYAKKYIQQRQRQQKEQTGGVSKSLYDAERKRSDQLQEELLKLRTEIDRNKEQHRAELHRVLTSQKNVVSSDKLKELERRYTSLQRNYNSLCDQLYGPNGLPDDEIPTYDQRDTPTPRNR